ncbi:MAG: PD40 domain-containing protein [Bryobacterales bacterium]|nr:PD40 domain-containing protein [Bryobacterales bacterium]
MGGQARLAWVDRGGNRLEWVGEAASGLLVPQLSPDEKQLAFSLAGDLWIRDLVRGLSTRFTFDPGLESWPVWSPDGERIVFGSNREGPNDLYVKPTSGAGQEEVLLKTEDGKVATDWANDGRWLLYFSSNPVTRTDLWVLPMEGERKPRPLVQTKFEERDGTFSPDGKWIAYASDESGRFQIVVQPYPATGAKWQASKDGGHWPRWRGDGKELYWLEQDGTLMAVEVNTGPALRLGIPRALFETRIQNSFEGYDVAKDGKRFLVPLPVQDRENSRPVTVIQNWLAGARR